MQFIGDYIDYPKYLGNHSQITAYRRKRILRYSIWANYSDLPQRSPPKSPAKMPLKNSGEGIGSCFFAPQKIVHSAQSKVLFPGPKLTLSIGFLLRSLKHNSWKMKKKDMDLWRSWLLLKATMRSWSLIASTYLGYEHAGPKRWCHGGPRWWWCSPPGLKVKHLKWLSKGMETEWTIK